MRTDCSLLSRIGLSRAGFSLPKRLQALGGLTGWALTLMASGAAAAPDIRPTFVGGMPRIMPEAQLVMPSANLSFRFVQPPNRPKAATQPYCPENWYEAGGTCQSDPYWQADLAFTLTNPGPARTLLVALPFDMPLCGQPGEINGPSVCNAEGVRNLSAELDGQAVAVTRQNAKITQPVALNRIYSVKLAFAKGQTRTLHQHYQTFTVSGAEGRRFRYLLRTGSRWARPVAEVTIAFELPPDNGPCAAVNLPFRREGNWLKTELSHWTPDRDLDIIFARRARVLAGSGVFSDASNLEQVCGAVQTLSAARRQLLADQIELLYGAPGRGQTEANRLGPLPICQASLYFREPGLTSWLQAGPLSFLPDPAYPGNLPPLLQTCLARLKQP